VLQEYRRRARPIVIDLLIWITVLAALAIIYGGLKVLESYGYPHENIELLEDVHLVVTACLLAVGGYFMIMEFVAAARGGKK